jgi:putative peptidoglycan lipid II flippase
MSSIELAEAPPRSLAAKLRRKGLSDTAGAIGVNIAGKGLAFVREAVISAVFGVTRLTDAYFVAQQFFLLPYTYILGAFNLAFVPAYARHARDGNGPAFVRRVARFVALGSLAAIPLCALGAVFAFGPGRLGTLAPFLFVMAWSVPCFGANGVACGLLYAEHAQTRAAVTSASVNWAQGVLLVVFALVGGGAGWVLSGSFALGAVVGLGVSAAVIRKRAAAAAAGGPAPDMKPFGKQVAVSSAENLGFSLNQLATVALAGRLGPGVVTVNALAFRLSNLPLAAIGTPVSQALQSWLLQDPGARVRAMKRKLAALTCLWLGIAAAFVAVARVVVTLVYQRGAFTAHDTKAVVAVMTAYMAYFAVMATNQMNARVLFALDRGGWYARAMIPAYVAETAAQIAVFHRFGLRGMIWAAVAAEGIAAIVLFGRTFRRIGEASRA